jgi:hypothetical protein
MSNEIKIEISPGELIDRLTILEIKLDRIQDAQKRRNVETEHAVVRPPMRSTFPFRRRSAAWSKSSAK